MTDIPEQPDRIEAPGRHGCEGTTPSEEQKSRPPADTSRVRRARRASPRWGVRTRGPPPTSASACTRSSSSSRSSPPPAATPTCCASWPPRAARRSRPRPRRCRSGSATAGRMRTLVNDGDLGPEEVRDPVDEIYPLSDHPLARRMLTDGIGYVQTPGRPGRRREDRADPAPGGEELLPRPPDPVRGPDLGRALGHPHRRPAAVHRGRPRLRAASSPPRWAPGIAQAEHLKRVERLAYTDDLTGLANRRGFEDRLDEALDPAPRDGHARRRRRRRRQRAQADQRPSRPRRRRPRRSPRSAPSCRRPRPALPGHARGAPRRRRVLPARRRRARRHGRRPRPGRLPTAPPSVLEEGVRVRRGHHRRPARRRRHAVAAAARGGRRAVPRQAVAASQRAGRGRTHGDAGRRRRDERDAPERRQFRGRGTADPGQALDEVLRRLDAAEDRDPCGRLVAVAEVLRESLDAASWFVVRAAGAGTSTIADDGRTPSSGVPRASELLRHRRLRRRRLPGDLRRADRALHRRRRRRPAQRPGRGRRCSCSAGCRRWSCAAGSTPTATAGWSRSAATSCRRRCGSTPRCCARASRSPSRR